MEPTLQSEILRLCDKGFLAQDPRKTDGGMPNAVYPVAAVSLFKGGHDEASWDRFVDTLDIGMRAVLRDMATEARKMPVVAEAAVGKIVGGSPR